VIRLKRVKGKRGEAGEEKKRGRREDGREEEER